MVEDEEKLEMLNSYVVEKEVFTIMTSIRNLEMDIWLRQPLGLNQPAEGVSIEYGTIKVSFFDRTSIDG